MFLLLSLWTEFMSRLNAFCPSRLECFAILIGAISIAFSMHWTFNIWPLINGLEGQGRNSLEAISIIQAYEATEARNIQIRGNAWKITAQNQEAYCLQERLFRPVAEWYASRPTKIKDSQGVLQWVLTRSWFPPVDTAKMVRFFFWLGYVFAVLLVLIANRRRPNLLASFASYSKSILLTLIFTQFLFSFSYYAPYVPEGTDVLTVSLQNEQELSASLLVFSELVGLSVIYALSLWLLPIFFLASNKVRTVLVCFCMWIISTPILLFLSGIDQFGCNG
jgi:hypothetical protein